VVLQVCGMEVVARIGVKAGKVGDHCLVLGEERGGDLRRLGWRSTARGQSKAVRPVVHR